MKMMRYTLIAAALLGAQSLIFPAPALAADKVCKLEITGNDQMQYDKKDLSVPADCTEVQLTLKHVGVVIQTMYLAATAMGLGPCAVGCGDADLFGRAAGTDYFAETSVGEFLLGSERQGPKGPIR